MGRLALLAIVLLASASLAVGSSAAESTTAAITTAAAAPYRDVLARDAPALCADLAHPPTISPAPPAGESCEQAVQGAWAAAAPPPNTAREAALSLRASATHLKVDEDHATGVFSFTATVRRATRRGVKSFALTTLGRFQLSLEEVSGRWLVSSPARLAAVADCQLNAPPAHCTEGVEDVLFALGLPVGASLAEEIPTPAAVRRAGAREHAEFREGASVLARSGCLACHRIAHVGNAGPGPNLTHVGALLSPAQIEHALVHPREPMPSFKHLPAWKLRVLVRFLSLMR